MRTVSSLCLIMSCVLSGGGHVPLASLPKLSQVDIRTTQLAALRAGISLPAEIRPLPGGITMTMVALPKDGGRHERKVVLEEVSDPKELAQLPSVAAPGRRFTVYRLSEADAAARLLAAAPFSTFRRLSVRVVCFNGLSSLSFIFEGRLRHPGGHGKNSRARTT